jgi:alpha-L-rhamnosidase
MALREAADLETAFGRPDRAQHYQLLAARIAASVQRACWDAGRHLIADTPARKIFSQHANILGILTNAVPQNRQEQVMKLVLGDPKLTQASYYFRYYLFRAMRKAGLADQYLQQLKPWQEMLALGLTTWAEEPEIGHSSRSDCHAWSAHPNFDLLATVAGIEPFSPGFRDVAIRPHLGHLKHLKATLPHPQGDVRVEYHRERGKLEADITLPSGVSGWFYWQGTETSLRAGTQHLSF